MLTQQQLALLSGPNPAVISTIDADGKSVTIPTWQLAEGNDRILLSIDRDNARGDRLTHLRRDPRFNLMVMSSEDWFEALTVFATAIEFFPDEELTLVDQMARIHGQDRFGRRTPRVAVRARIDSVLS